MITKRKINLAEPEILIHKPLKTTNSIVFLNRQNTEYEIVEDKFKEIGIVKSYKEHILAGIDPNYDKNNSTYGVARKYQPKTKTIQEMRDNIDKATDLYYNSQNQQQEQEQEQPIEKEEDLTSVKQ